jgi:CheY-like chemotaxis protein
METMPVILLVDDEPDFLDNLILTLEMAGYQPLTPANGVEAWWICLDLAQPEFSNQWKKIGQTASSWQAPCFL